MDKENVLCIHRGMDKENVLCILSYKKNEIVPFAETQRD